MTATWIRENLNPTRHVHERNPALRRTKGDGVAPRGQGEESSPSYSRSTTPVPPGSGFEKDHTSKVRMLAVAQVEFRERQVEFMKKLEEKNKEILTLQLHLNRFQQPQVIKVLGKLRHVLMDIREGHFVLRDILYNFKRYLLKNGPFQICAKHNADLMECLKVKHDSIELEKVKIRKEYADLLAAASAMVRIQLVDSQDISSSTASIIKAIETLKNEHKVSAEMVIMLRAECAATKAGGEEVARALRAKCDAMKSERDLLSASLAVERDNMKKMKEAHKLTIAQAEATLNTERKAFQVAKEAWGKERKELLEIIDEGGADDFASSRRSSSSDDDSASFRRRTNETAVSPRHKNVKMLMKIKSQVSTISMLRNDETEAPVLPEQTDLTESRVDVPDEVTPEPTFREAELEERADQHLVQLRARALAQCFHKWRLRTTTSFTVTNDSFGKDASDPFMSREPRVSKVLVPHPPVPSSSQPSDSVSNLSGTVSPAAQNIDPNTIEKALSPKKSVDIHDKESLAQRVRLLPRDPSPVEKPRPSLRIIHETGFMTKRPVAPTAVDRGGGSTGYRFPDLQWMAAVRQSIQTSHVGPATAREPKLITTSRPHSARRTPR